MTTVVENEVKLQIYSRNMKSQSVVHGDTAGIECFPCFCSFSCSVFSSFAHISCEYEGWIPAEDGSDYGSGMVMRLSEKGDGYVGVCVMLPGWSGNEHARPLRKTQARLS